MRRQTITRVVDMLGGPQARVVLWLACNHKISINEMDIRADATLPLTLKNIRAGHSTAECPFCPDPTPEDVRVGKSATQLWKEAGEP